MNLLSNLWTLLGVAGAALGGMVLAYFRGRRAGRENEKSRRTEDTLNKVDQINEARSDNAARTDDELRDKLLRDIRQRRSR
jgi:membrane protein DedA with SNARE-associated domain